MKAAPDLDTIEETECDDDQPLETFHNVRHDAKLYGNRFHLLCDTVQTCFSEIDDSMFEFLALKDKLLCQFLPVNALLNITVVSSRLYRAYSQAQIPVNELIRLFHLYSEPMDAKCAILKKLYDSNLRQKRLLNAAFQKLTAMDNRTEQHEAQKCINNWEKMYIRLALPRSNIRRWKFRMPAFREKAELGYEHVIDWIGMIESRRSSVAVVNLPEKSDNTSKTNQVKTVPSNIENILVNDAPNYPDKVNEEESKPTEKKLIVETVSIGIQVQPDTDNHETSTEDILVKRALVMRIHRPIGILKAQFQCVVHAQGRVYKTSVFNLNKSNSSLDENKNYRKRSDGSRTSKSIDSKTTKSSGALTGSDESDINTIETGVYHELSITMPNILKRRSLFHADIDPDAITIEVFGDETLCGSLVISSEDLLMLDLPNLQNVVPSPFVDINDEMLTISSLVHRLDFDLESHDIYHASINRRPQLFSIYNTEKESIGKLPIIMFWYNQVGNVHATKGTMTTPIKFTVPVSENSSSQGDEVSERAGSRMYSNITDESVESNSLALTDDYIELLRASYEKQIAKIHKDYEDEIYRLKNHLIEPVPQELSQLIDSSQLGTSTLAMINDLSTLSTQEQTTIDDEDQAKIEVQLPSINQRNAPKNRFLDRYHMHLQRSISHRRALTAHIQRETALENERRMEVQHHLYKAEQDNNYDSDLCLPAIFMPFRSGNIYNPKAYQYSHPIGAAGLRLAQVPSIFKLPSLSSESVSILNMFKLTRHPGVFNDKNHDIKKKD